MQRIGNIRNPYLTVNPGAIYNNEDTNSYYYNPTIFRWFFADIEFTWNDWRYAGEISMQPRVIAVSQRLLLATQKTTPVIYPASH